MNFDEFITKYCGKKVDFDKVFGAQCFTKGHCVLTADWTYKPIQDICVGDKVIGYDNQASTVTQLFKRTAKVLHLRTELSDLYVTPEHPFYCLDGNFKKASELTDFEPALFDHENYSASGLTDNELLFLGFWLGDGNVAKHNNNRTDEIRITYGEAKRDFILSLKLIGSERQHQESDRAYVAGLLKREHPQLADIILTKCAGAEKKLPLIFSNRELDLIIQGLIQADGSLHHNSYVITNTSLPLLLSIQAAAIKLGYATKSLRLSRRNSDYIRIKGKLVKSVKPLYRLTLAKTSQQHGKRYLQKLDLIEDTVYNIETDGTHTYICNNYKVHNCVDLFRQYCFDVLHIPHTGGVDGAKELYENYKSMPLEQKYFTLLTAKAVPQFGYTAVWGATPTNKYGHVALVIGRIDASTLLVFEQNGFTQDGAKVAQRSTKNLLGYLKYKGA